VRDRPASIAAAAASATVGAFLEATLPVTRWALLGVAVVAGGFWIGYRRRTT
jgi:hypothetical protein